MTTYFTAAAFAFLRELDANNNRDWWEDNKVRYLETIREPALDFIADFGPRLERSVSPHLTADTRVNGGSLMRPYRDVRFSRDKTPYKTNVGIQFRHEAGKDVHAPGFYVHIEPRQSFIGAGLWRPEPTVARRIRQAINDRGEAWHESAHGRTFTSNWSLGDDEDDRLKRVPRELDVDHHPHPDDLRLKSFIAMKRINQRTVTSAAFADELVKSFRTAVPFTRFLCEAVGVPF